MKKAIITLSIFINFNLVNSQPSSLFMPPQFQDAYKKGTRSWDGKPGPGYWQNTARYIIKAEYDPATRIISGSEEILYINNSPDSIPLLVTKLYQNAYKKGNARDLAISTDLITDGVEIVKFAVRGKTYYKDNQVFLEEVSPFMVQVFGTNLIIILRNDPIKPGEEIPIEVSWKVRLPERSELRTGYWDSTSFFAGYWYPQIAVYDDITGWDLNSYTGIQETYGEKSDYDVQLTIPAEYIIWATGEHLNEQEIFESDVLKKVNESKKSDGYTKIIDSKAYQKGVINGSGMKTWKFRAEDVPDFAWGASDHFTWDATSLVVDSAANRRVWISSVYPENEHDYSDVIHFARESIAYLSYILPGVPYPYSKHTTFHGLRGGGMEFPMMANNNYFRDSVMRFDVTGHEIAHNYFLFMCI